ncbi:MAG: hypothetical protein KDC73_03745 [Ignavibacteriae bacterium]|nr:hypothetical protein [Ignavibacteriota bacterium]MCB9244166.1 hypothetical protein [Ignavibacteriales bacterium]
MDKRLYRDIFICILLVGSLFTAAFFVSCSEDNSGIVIGPNNNNNGNIGGGEIITSSLSQFFGAVGEGAEGALGFSINGWILGAMGLAGNSPDYGKQIALIESDLDTIITLLGSMDSTLNEINQTLQILNCSEQTSSLQTEIGSIENLYIQYTSMIETASDTTLGPVSDSVIQAWSDQVIATLPNALSTIESNLSNQTGVLHACIITIPPPSTFGTTAFGGDTIYYNNVDALTNYYYYYQVIALSMISDALHFNAWVAACSQDSCTFPADSIQAVCNQNSTAMTYCNDVRGYTNDLYNSLLTQFSYGGASYTNEYTTLQYIQNNPIVWVRSLEDFTQQAGYNCPDPQINPPHITSPQPCGPTAGNANSVLRDTVYRGTSGFSFANGQELYNLIDAASSLSFNTNGDYLESKGFKNMSEKTIISANPGNTVVISQSYQNLQVTPFFLTDQKAFLYNGENISVYYTGNAFSYLFPSTVYSYGTCTPAGTHYQNQSMTLLYQFIQSVYDYDKLFFNDGDIAFVTLCLNNGDWQLDSPFAWNEEPPNWTPLSDSAIYRFLMPKVYAYDAHCKSGRTNVNLSGVPTMCGEDFNIFLNTNIPRPPTCSNTKIFPACTTLN